MSGNESRQPTETRLAAMPGKSFADRFRARRTARLPLLGLALAGFAVVVAGCGSDGDGSIPPDVSDDLLNRVDAVEQSVAAGDCDLAEQQAEALVNEAGALPAEVEAEVRRALAAGASQLAELTATQCEQTTGATGFQETEPVEPEPQEEQAPPEEEQPEEDEQEQQQPEEQPSEGQDGGGEQPPTDGGGEEQPPTEGENGGGESPPTGGTEPETGGVISPERGQSP
jgi:hypothetical protein